MSSYIRYELIANKATQDAYRRAFSEEKVRRRLARRASLIIRSMEKTIIPLLQDEPPVRSPYSRVRWASAKQRRAVLAFLRKSGNLPYQRTGRLRSGWKVNFQPSAARGELATLSVTNPASAVNAKGQTVRYATYVVGTQQQPFHADTGWYEMDSVLKTVRGLLNSALQQAIEAESGQKDA